MVSTEKEKKKKRGKQHSNSIYLYNMGENKLKVLLQPVRVEDDVLELSRQGRRSSSGIDEFEEGSDMAQSVLHTPLTFHCAIILSLLAMAALLDCGASRELHADDDLEQAYNSIYRMPHRGGSLPWRKMRSKLIGFSPDEIKYLLEALSNLEQVFDQENNSLSQGGSRPQIQWQIFDDFDVVDEVQNQLEKHPGDHLLQSYKADATVSYILGGY